MEAKPLLRETLIDEVKADWSGLVAGDGGKETVESTVEMKPKGFAAGINAA